MATSATKPSTPRLSEVARHVVVPKGIVSTGFPAVEAKCAELGLTFRWWQRPIAQIILGKRDTGKYAATIGGIGLSIPRQVGKTFLVGAIVFALCLLRPNLTVVWSAHRLRTAEETFKKMQALTRRKRIAPFVEKVVLGSGEEEIRFTNGSRILFGARAAGFGRGFDEVDVVVYDEAQILGENALDDMIPAMNQCRQDTGALLLFMGTPPKPSDPGEIFTRMRTEALSGDDEDTGWVEFGSDPGYEPTPLPAPLSEEDWRQVAKANPSFPADTPREAILRMRKKLGASSFLREGLGVWDDASGGGVFPGGAWRRRATTSKPPLPMALGVAADLDQEWFALGACSVPVRDDVHHIGSVLRLSDRPAFVAEVVRIHREHGIPVGIDSKGPAAILIPDLEDEGVTLVPLKLDDFIQACADMCDAVEQGLVEHGSYADLEEAVESSGWRQIGDRRAFGRKSGDIAALEAVTIARHVALANSYDLEDSIA